MTKLRELRKSLGYTQIKMQFLTGIDQSAYSKLELGKRNMSFEQCRQLALALRTSMDYLAGLTDDPAPYPRKDP
jgi:transcriptional regulator with XRE-family HTH domain